MDKTQKRSIWLAVFTFAVSPLLSWASVLATDESGRILDILSRLPEEKRTVLRLLTYVVKVGYYD